MNYATKLLIFIGLSMMILSCTKNQEHTHVVTANDHAQIYQQLLNIEYALLKENHELAKLHSKNLDLLLKESYNLFCPEESARIDGARMTNQILVQHIGKKEINHLLDDLRILKATIIHLESDEDYDPYLQFLWGFEEEMHAATTVAINPMLDLYEWNEFEYMVDCMNDAWQSVKMHRPSPEILNHDLEKYNNQAVHKIYLENALEGFNKAVATVDYEQFPLCESAEKLQRAYLDYLNTFIQNTIEDDSFLAKL